MDKMTIYEAGRSVPKEAQKPFSNGKFSGTDINPMWRIKKLTELFGAAGVGWYYEVLSERCEEHDGQTMAIVDINLYIKVDGEWSKPIYGTGGNMLVRKGKNGNTVSDEGYKMALTDAIGIAAKALGIGADIWFANDKTKYTANSAPAASDDLPWAEPSPPPREAESGKQEVIELDSGMGRNIKPLECEECLQPIKAYTSPKGVYTNAFDVAKRSHKDTGRILCADCWMKEAKR